jgi:hypothetical protein
MTNQINVEEYQIRECRICTSLIANHRAYGRKANPADPTLCECCMEEQHGSSYRQG